MDLIGVVEGFCFVSDADDLAFLGVELHFVVRFPGLEGVQVCLKDILVIR